ncbi:MAG: PD-(D/E)XK nuclease family protein [Actinomycetota bacterium]|nr:PD-(D/E)XK nuclease family protein [Actinomycetota bacterium]
MTETAGALELPSTLTPSKLSRFISCPLAFRLAYIDRLPEPASPHQVRGTLVHRALQLLFGTGRPAERTRDQAVAALDRAWSELSGTTEVAELGLDEPGEAAFVREAQVLLERYFGLEDPTEVRPVGLELDLRASVGGVELRGIIDRLDRLEDGEFVVVDYKTGRAPRAEQAQSRLGALHFYAFLCEQVLGRRPREVRLIYLRDQVVIAQAPTDQSMRGLRQRALAVWAAIERACGSGDFRPNPSRLCSYCAFQARCPAMARRVPVALAPQAAAAAH